MIIHLTRHAEAIERTPEVIEEQRFLTRRGRKRFRQVAKSLAKLALAPDVILTSPLVRSVQTAEILSEALRFKRDLVVVPQLGPGFGMDALEHLQSEYGQAREIAFVGHEPDFGVVVQALFGANAACPLPKGGTITFKRTTGHKGEATFVHFVSGGGRIITSRGKALDRLEGDGRSK